MIAIETITNLTTAVVCVGNPSSPTAVDINLDALTQIIEMPDVQQNPDGFVLSSMRNQLVVNINPARLQFQDRSQEEPARPDFPARVLQTVDFFRNSIGFSLTAVGIVFEVRANSGDARLPSEELQTIVTHDLFSGTRYKTIGASLRTWYAHDVRQYDLRVEPVGNQFEGQGYFGRLHVHIPLRGNDEAQVDWLSQALRKEYNDFKTVLTRINQQMARSN